MIKQSKLREAYLRSEVESGGGQERGILSLPCNVDAARDLAEPMFRKQGRDFDSELPDFDENLQLVNRSVGKFAQQPRRRHMPVISNTQIPEFIKFLKENKVSCKSNWVVTERLIPIQRPADMYLDKCFKGLAKYGTKGAHKYTKKKPLICSKRGFILDGHHGWLSASLVNPAEKVYTVIAKTDIRTLMRLANQFSDSMGNKRNQ